jgi:hypothetical protein
LLFAEFWNGDGSQSLWALKAIFKETVKTSHYAPVALGIFGLVWFRKKLDAAFAVVLCTGSLNAILLFWLAMKSMPTDFSPGSEAVPPYVSERHTLLLAYLACLFTGGLLATDAPLGFFSRRGCALGLLIALLASALPATFRHLHENREGHHHAGQYLGGQLQPGDAVIDPFEWAHWYSGRELYAVPPDPKDVDLKARWVVWEPTAGTKQNPHSRLPRLEAARNVVEDRANPPVLMYQWPEGVQLEQAKVVVYKQTTINR